MTWNEILIRDKSQNHAIAIGELGKAAQDRLVEIQLDDLDSLISLRVGSIERVWGFREENVFLVLWWDPKHQVYPTSPKS